MPPSGLAIRPATSTDLDAINAIYNEQIAGGVATWDTEPWSTARRRDWWEGHNGADQPILVAEDAGTIAGFAYLTYMSQKPGWRFTREATVYLGPGYRGRGHGRLLLAALLDEGRRAGVRLVVASIESENAASLALCRSLGFTEVGTLRNAGYKFGRWLSTTYMQKDLGPPAAPGPSA